MILDFKVRPKAGPEDVATKKRAWMDGLFLNSSNFQWGNVKT